VARSLWFSAVVVGAIVSILFWIDPIFIPLALLGPLAIGGYAGVRRLPWLWAVTAVVVAGLGAVVSDWIVNHEDVVFHLLLTIVMYGLATLGWWLGGVVQSRRVSR
jgi:hypothetical protein